VDAVMPPRKTVTEVTRSSTGEISRVEQTEADA
jgi:hypothetical protein